MKRPAPAFTLLEMLVSLTIVAVMSMLLLSSFRMAMASARSTRCVNNLKQIGAALHTFAQDHDGEIIRWVDDGPDFWCNVLTKGGYLPKSGAGTIWSCPANTTGLLNPGETAVSTFGTAMTYAINAVWPSASYDHKSGPSYPTSGNYRNKMSYLEVPSKTIAVCDGKSWLIHDSSGQNKGTAAGVHNGGMNAVFWDGHAEHFTTVLSNSDPLFSVSAH